MDDGRLLVSTCTLPLSGLGQLRVGCIERRGDAPPREMTAQAEAIPLDRMRLIDRPEANIFDCLVIKSVKHAKRGND